jgi:transketolase
VPPKFEAWRQIIFGDGPLLVVLGPLVGIYIDVLCALDKPIRPNVWVVSLLPVCENPPPKTFVDRLALDGRLIVAEEHVERGGLGWDLLVYLQKSGICISKFWHLFAKKHNYEFYGSQAYLRKQSELDPESLMSILFSMRENNADI